MVDGAMMNVSQFSHTGDAPISFDGKPQTPASTGATDFYIMTGIRTNRR